MKTKPKPQNRKSLDWTSCTEFIEARYKIDTRDYARSHAQFGEWCKANGENPVLTPPGCSPEVIKECQKQYARFNADIASGKVVERPYQDFWHWLIDHADIRRGGTMELDREMIEGAEPWQKEIFELYWKEFGKGPYLTDW